MIKACRWTFWIFVAIAVHAHDSPFVFWPSVYVAVLALLLGFVHVGLGPSTPENDGRG